MTWTPQVCRTRFSRMNRIGFQLMQRENSQLLLQTQPDM